MSIYNQKARVTKALFKIIHEYPPNHIFKVYEVKDLIKKKCRIDVKDLKEITLPRGYMAFYGKDRVRRNDLVMYI